MKQKLYSLFLAALLGMLGMQVGAQELTTTEIDGVTYYVINDSEELLAFAELVNTSEQDANAVLAADIDMIGVEWDTPIGVETSTYAGTFDGQGHKITGFQAISAGQGGFFGHVTTATIKNLSIAGTLDVIAGTGSGAIGYAVGPEAGKGCRIINVHSSLNITVSEAGCHHVGGVVGSSQYNNYIRNCTFSGTMSVVGGNHDCFGGVVGYMGNDSILYSANYGEISFSTPNAYCGGILGYLNNAGGTVKGCLNLGKVSFTEEGDPDYGGAIIGRLRGNTPSRLTNNCWLEGTGKVGTGESSVPSTREITATELPSGELCYYLNGDQTDIGWFQTLPVDEQPTLDATHGQVYMIGRLHCNGDAYTDATYSNEYAEVIQDDHDCVDGFCSYCGLWFEDYFTPNADGFYEIANARQLTWFEMKVNKGELTANAILTADIDFADLMPEGADPDETEVAWTPIGDWGATRGTSSAGYQGHFDGQGHTIKNLNATSKQNYFGLFGVISTDCLIENFDIYGTYNTTYQYAGSVAAYARDDRPTIRNIHSFVNINNSSAGGRQGGILGGVLTTTYRTTIENCTYSGTLDGNDAGGSGNYGGIIGYVNNNGNTVADITNCLFDGEVVNKNSAPGGCTFGGFVGYSNGGVVTIKNGLSIGHVESAVYGQFFGAVKSTKSSLPNSYYMGEPINGSASTVTLTATETTSDELLSGEICWKLNEETFINVVWHQIVNDQAYPVPYGDEGVVYQTKNGNYECISNDPESLRDFINDVAAGETEFLEDIIAYQTLIDAYKAEIESWEDIETLEEFFAAYEAASELKESIKASAAKYEAYQKACEDAAAYIEENNLAGETTDILITYLENDVDPDETYPNGSFSYIMENLNLDDDALDAEIAFVNQMLEAAVSADGIIPGNEVTRLLTNANFANEYDGWTVVSDGGTATVAGVTEIMPIPEGYNNNSFDASQTLTDLPNGIYMIAVNSLFRAGSDIYSKFYAGQVYLNNTVNYIMAIGEDAISVDEAEPGVNCLGENGDAAYENDGMDCWVPNSRNGCSYAFNAGRYQNFTVAEVTDGTLTVGMRNLGTGLSKDWLPFGNMHLFYLGSADEADNEGKLTEVLESYVDRAEVILNFDWDEGDEFNQYPNISEDLKLDLEDAISAAEDPEDIMALIGTFSNLFNQVHACRKAYIAMLGAANNLQDIVDYLDAAGIIDDTVYNSWTTEINEAVDHYSEGDLTAEEALAIAERLNNANLIDLEMVDDYYQLATADDVQLFSVIVNAINPKANAVLTADIDMSTLIEDGLFEPIGNSDSRYAGEFDGQNHKITGFGQYIQEEGEEGGFYNLALSGDNQGFFGYASGATIKNFSIEGAFEYNGGTGAGAIGLATGTKLINIHSSLNIAIPEVSHHVGGVCGHLSENSSATNCSFSGSINDIAGTNDCIGGIGAYSNNGVKYTNCANYGTITYKNANAYAGGICGYVNNNSFTGIFNCINVGKVAEAGGGQSAGALVGRLRDHSSSQFLNNYILQGSAIKAGNNDNGVEAISGVPFVTAEQMASGEICFKLNGSQSEEVNWYQTLGEDEYPLLFDTHKIVYITDDGIYTNEKTTSPIGSKDNPFVVKSAADLSNLINQLVSGRMNYVVMEDNVDMAGVTNWTPLFNIPDQSNGYPYIDFDGQGHVISNLTSNTTGAYDYCGLFGVLCGNVRNLGVENATVECAGGTGILAGYLGHSTYGQTCYIENVWVTGKVTANGYCGGMFGNIADESHITNCYANVEVNGSGDLTGGIIGRVRNKVVMNNVYAAGTINRGGGIIGGGFQAATPDGSYTNVAVWNNTENNFGPARSTDTLSGILYYNGSNFADLQSQVVAWDPTVWSCDMEPGSYPILAAFDPDGIKGVMADESSQSISIYNIAGQRLSKVQKGINIVNGKKVLVK